MTYRDGAVLCSEASGTFEILFFQPITFIQNNTRSLVLLVNAELYLASFALPKSAHISTGMALCL
jgi:hypothetical protein